MSHTSKSSISSGLGGRSLSSQRLSPSSSPSRNGDVRGIKKEHRPKASPRASRVSIASNTKEQKPRASIKGDGGRIQVAVRCRPLNVKEKKERSSFIWSFSPEHVEELQDDGSTRTGKTWAFDNVFDPEVSTKQLFQSYCKPIVHSALDGYNGTIFAYGQTSSGKTYTLMGTPHENPGVSILAIDEVFDWITKLSIHEWDTYASYIEIYNDSVTDLLQRNVRKGKNLKVVEDKNYGPTVKDLTELAVLNRQHCLDLILDGEKRRTYAATNLNEASSRSHTIFAIRTESRKGSGGNEEVLCDNMRVVASDFLQMQNKLTADHASLYLLDQTTNELFIQAGEITLRLPMTQGIAGAVATSGQTINIADAYEDDRFNRSIDMKTGYRTKSILCMPIRNSDAQIIGVVQFINKMQPNSAGFDQLDEQLVAGLTQRLGPLISSAQRDATISTKSRLNLVDLAGSERVAKSGATGGILKQAGYINQSLHTLGACISILAEGKRQHVPFRDSKLTHLLSTSLGGNAKTCLICAISPASSNRNETLSTLQFASRAKKVINHFHRNCQQDQTELVAAYEVEILRLKAALNQGAARNSVNYRLEANQECDTVPAISSHFRERLVQFKTSVAEADRLANESLTSAEYRYEMMPLVASEDGENLDPKLVVAVRCCSEYQNHQDQLLASCLQSMTETWISEDELYLRLAWLQKQEAAGTLSSFLEHGSNAWEAASAALGSGIQVSGSNGLEESSVLHGSMSRDQERKFWKGKVRKLDNKLLVLKNYVEHISKTVKLTSQLTKRLQSKKNHMASHRALPTAQVVNKSSSLNSL